MANSYIQTEIFPEEGRATQHVTVQSSEGGDVEAAYPRGLLPNDGVKDRYEGRLRLSDASRGDEKDVPSPLNQGHGLNLGLGELPDAQFLESLDDPLVDGKLHHALSKGLLPNKNGSARYRVRGMFPLGPYD